MIDETKTLADISSIYQLFVSQKKQTLDAFKTKMTNCNFFVLLHPYVYYILSSIQIWFAYFNYTSCAIMMHHHVEEIDKFWELFLKL